MNELIKYKNGALELDVQVSPKEETVWLTQAQMEKLFDVKHATISYHINNIYSTGELENSFVEKFDKSSGGRQPKLYNLDMMHRQHIVNRKIIHRNLLLWLFTYGFLIEFVKSYSFLILDVFWVSVFPFHCVHRYNPLFSIFTYINTIY